MSNQTSSNQANSRQRAQLYWEQSLADQKEAKRAFKAGTYPEASFLAFQSAINALSSLCLLDNQFRLPSARAGEMLSQAISLAPALESLEASCQVLDSVEALNPFKEIDTEKLKGDSKSHLEAGAQVVKQVKLFLKQNRKQFFTP